MLRSVHLVLFAGVVLCRAAFGDQESDDQRAIIRGDLSGIQKAYDNQNIKKLWWYYGGAFNRQFGMWPTQGEENAHKALSREMRVQLNSRVQDAAAKLLVLLPGHAKYLGDKIDAASNDPHSNAARIVWMQMLSSLGSTEAIQQIGRFLFDDRNPEFEVMAPQTDVMPPPDNQFVAITQMYRALKNESLAKKNARPALGVNYEPLLDWWRSDASLSYRQQLPGVELPEIVRHPPSAKEVESRHRASKARLEAVSPEAGGQPLPLWVNVVAILSVASLAVWLAAHKRVKNATPPVSA